MSKRSERVLHHGFWIFAIRATGEFVSGKSVFREAAGKVSNFDRWVCRGNNGIWVYNCGFVVSSRGCLCHLQVFSFFCIDIVNQYCILSFLPFPHPSITSEYCWDCGGG